MSPDVRMWMEIVFNLSYLAAIWALVVVMGMRLSGLANADRRMASPLVAAFGLLALGDTGHVGFRVWAYALGDLEARASVGGLELGLVGLGALATAVTVTLFYVLVLIAWQRRFAKPLGLVGGVLLLAAIVRLGLMTLPQNDWNSSVPPQPWSLIRNLPLMLQGLGVAALILRDATRARDRAFQWIGVWILVSFAFYLPVILFVQLMPVLGMLMIPKTLAYLACAWIVFRYFFTTGDRLVAPGRPLTPRPH